MSITTFSAFYYGHTVTSSNCNLDFKDGGSAAEKTAVISIGTYSLSDYIVEIKTALDAAGTQVYTVAVNRTTRKITISAAGAFSLMITSGSHVSSSPWAMMGFSGADQTGITTSTGAAGSGSEYLPQFVLQDFVDKEDSQGLVDASVNQSASGAVEVVRFGTESFYELNIKYITSIAQPGIGPIKNNASGLANARTFMQYIITKAPIEFMKNIADRSTFDTVLLESTPDDSKGTAYKLKEQLAKNLPGYFDSGILTFRIID
jgi:hypothetical protein